MSDQDNPVTLDMSTLQPVDKTSSGDKPVTLDMNSYQAHSLSMVGPKGQTEQVPIDQVPAMREKNYALTEQPGTQKMVDMKGGFTHVLPNEVDAFRQQGYTPTDTASSGLKVNTTTEAPGILAANPTQAALMDKNRIRSDKDVDNAAIMQKKSGTTGMTPGNSGGALGIPIMQSSDYEYKAGVPQDVKDALKHSDNAQKSAAKVMVTGAATGLGAIGGNALLAPRIVTSAIPAGTGFGGAAASTADTVMPSLASSALRYVITHPLQTLGAIGVTGGALHYGPKLLDLFKMVE